jgi:hypothetical protein
MHIKLYNKEKNNKLNKLLGEKQHILLYSKFFIRNQLSKVSILDDSFNNYNCKTNKIYNGFSLNMDLFLFKNKFNKNFSFYGIMKKNSRSAILQNIIETTHTLNNLILLYPIKGGISVYGRGIIGLLPKVQLKYLLQYLFKTPNLLTNIIYNKSLNSIRLPFFLFKNIMYSFSIKNNLSKRKNKKTVFNLFKTKFFILKKSEIYEKKTKKTLENIILEKKIQQFKFYNLEYKPAIKKLNCSFIKKHNMEVITKKFKNTYYPLSLNYFKNSNNLLNSSTNNTTVFITIFNIFIKKNISLRYFTKNDLLIQNFFVSSSNFLKLLGVVYNI